MNLAPPVYQFLSAATGGAKGRTARHPWFTRDSNLGPLVQQPASLTASPPVGFKSENCVGRGECKECLNALLATNEDGPDKITPLVIKKFLKPRCIKNYKSLSLFYNANSKAWTMADTFAALCNSIQKRNKKTAWAKIVYPTKVATCPKTNLPLHFRIF